VETGRTLSRAASRLERSITFSGSCSIGLVSLAISFLRKTIEELEEDSVREKVSQARFKTSKQMAFHIDDRNWPRNIRHSSEI